MNIPSLPGRCLSATSARFPSCQAFTLIEILVVIGIIATLSALSFSMLSGTMAKGKDAACLSNQRQLGVGVMLYVADNQTYPAGSFKDKPGSANPYAYWTDAIAPYLGQDGQDIKWARDLGGVFDCPAKTIPTADHEMAYTVNPNVMPDAKYSSASQLRSMMQVQRPSSTILLADACQRDNGKVQAYMFKQPGIYDRNESKAEQPVDPGTDKDGINYAAPRYRHGNDTAANFLFADGHAQSIKKGDLLHKHLQIEY